MHESNRQDLIVRQHEEMLHECRVGNDLNRQSMLQHRILAALEVIALFTIAAVLYFK